MVKRLMKIIIFTSLTPLFGVGFFPSLVFYTIRWIITGKEFGNPTFTRLAEIVIEW